MADPGTLNAWYDLLKKVFADLRGSAFAAEAARRENYKLLFDDLRGTHKAYVELFLEFKNAVYAATDADQIEAAKTRFLDQRAPVSQQRTFLSYEAEALAKLDLPGNEKAFLETVRTYLIVQWYPSAQMLSFLRDAPSQKIGSMSDWFYSQIQQKTDRDSLLRETDRALETISESYSGLIASYSEIDPAFRLSSAE